MALWTNVDEAAGKPKYLSTADKAATSGISVAEAGVAANKNKGVAHAGWVKTTTYTDAQGATRNKSEVLVAMSSISSDNNADDTTIGIDPVITIATQPAAVAATLGEAETVTFTVAATVNNGGALAYAWEFSEDAGSSWESEQPGWATGFNTATITIADADTDLGGGAGDLNGYLFRVVVSSTGAADVTSNAAELTVTA